MITIEMRKTFRKRVGRTLISGGLGRHGPYVLAYRKVDRRTGVKASFGTRGLEVQLDRKIGRRTRISAGYGSVRGPYAKIGVKKRRPSLYADIKRRIRKRRIMGVLLSSY